MWEVSSRGAVLWCSFVQDVLGLKDPPWFWSLGPFSKWNLTRGWEGPSPHPQGPWMGRKNVGGREEWKEKRRKWERAQDQVSYHCGNGGVSLGGKFEKRKDGLPQWSMKRNRGKQWNGKDRDLFKKIRHTKGTKEPLDEREKVGIKLNIQKTKIMASSPITSWQIDGKQWKQWQTLFFSGSKITADSDCTHEIKRRLPLGRKVLTNLAY